MENQGVKKYNFILNIDGTLFVIKASKTTEVSL